MDKSNLLNLQLVVRHIEPILAKHKEIAKDCTHICKVTNGNCDLYTVIFEKYNYLLDKQDRYVLSMIERDVLNETIIRYVRETYCR